MSLSISYKYIEVFPFWIAPTPREFRLKKFNVSQVAGEKKLEYTIMLPHSSTRYIPLGADPVFGGAKIEPV